MRLPFVSRADYEIVVEAYRRQQQCLERHYKRAEEAQARLLGMNAQVRRLRAKVEELEGEIGLLEEAALDVGQDVAP